MKKKPGHASDIEDIDNETHFNSVFFNDWSRLNIYYNGVLYRILALFTSPKIPPQTHVIFYRTFYIIPQNPYILFSVI